MNNWFTQTAKKFSQFGLRQEAATANYIGKANISALYELAGTLDLEGFTNEARLLDKLAAKTIQIKTAAKEKKLKLVSSVAVFRNNEGTLEVLLERRGKPPERYKWSLPGGHVDKGEDFIETARRELKEETGLTPDNLEFVWEIDKAESSRDKDDVLFAALVPMEQSNAKAASDADALKWTSIHELPDLIWEHDLFIELALRKLFQKPSTTEAIPLLPISTNRGTLIVFEGIDGAGKSVQTNELLKKLDKEGYDVVTTKWASSSLVKPALKKGKKKKILSPMLYSLLHAADLTDRYEREILPALAKDKVVVCDRYVYTSYVRDAIRGTNIDLLNAIYSEFRKPDVLIYCQVPLEVAFKRLSFKGGTYYGTGMDLHLDYDEMKNCKEYQRLMLDEYEKLMPKDAVRINTKGSIKDVSKEVWYTVGNVLQKKTKKKQLNSLMSDDYIALSYEDNIVKTQTDVIIYQDDNKKFTVTITVDSTNQLNEITSLVGPGLSGAVAMGDDTTAFLQLMYQIQQDLNLG